MNQRQLSQVLKAFVVKLFLTREYRLKDSSSIQITPSKSLLKIIMCTGVKVGFWNPSYAIWPNPWYLENKNTYKKCKHL